MSLFRTKSIDALIADSEAPGRRLSKTLGPWSLTALGIGAVIGSGIFVLTGTAAAGDTLAVPSIWKAPVLEILLQGGSVDKLYRPGAGPAISLSFILLAFVCALAALCYAELASMIPVAGSAYTYAYATLGEIFAWVIGWDLILEYAVSNMAVAVGFSAYFNDMLDAVFGVHLPRALSEPMIVGGEFTGSLFNVPALLIIMTLTYILVRGVRESSSANNTMVLVKVVAIIIFIVSAGRAVSTDNWHPFMPNGFSGVITGAAIVFFSYIGFDSVSTAAEECRNPQRDLPFGILMTLLICTLLYVGVSLVLTGVANWTNLNNAAPVVGVLKDLGYDTVRRIVGIGALMGMISSLLVFQYGQARVWFAMSRDRLLPSLFSRVHHKHQTPHVSTWIAGLAVGIPAGIWDVGTFADLSNIGTLFAFSIVSLGVLVLRKKQPERHRGFRVPLVPAIPLLSIFCCFVLMLGLPLETWFRFFVWLGLGLVIYFSFGRKAAATVQNPSQT
ncbi:MAG TPA: amino acid permease [Bryobacteraceae bacterium]|nr:amino acid permease [Bryobacteraceae bacterium]